MNFVKSSLATFSTSFIVFLSQFAIGIIVARTLGPEKKGIYTIVILVYTISLLMGNLGIGNANVYLIGKKKLNPSDVVANSIMIAVVMGIIIFLAFLVIEPFFRNSLFKGVHLNLLLLIVSITPLGLVSLYSGNIFQALDDFFKYNFLEGLRSIIKLLFMILLLLIFRLNIEGSVLSWVFTEICILFVTIYLLKKKIDTISLRPRYQVFKQSIFFGLKSFGEIFFLYINYQIDMILVAYFLSNREAGYYSIAFSISRMLLLLPTSIGIVLYPQLTLSEKDEANRFTGRVTRNLIFIMAIVLTIIALLARIFIKLVYGAAFLPSVKPLLFLLPGVLAISVYKQLTRNFLSQGKPQISALLSFGGLFISLMAGRYLVPKYGITGGALTSSISFGFMAIGTLIIFRKLSGLGAREILVIGRDDVTNFFYFLKNKMSYKMIWLQK